MGLAAAVTPMMVFSCGDSQSGNPNPNIVIFLVDDMGLMDTSLPFLADSAGNPQKQALNYWYHTPNMERLAEQGVRFSQFYAQSVSSPSRTSLLTGQNATRHGVTNWIYSESNNRNTYGPPDWNWQGLDSNDYTLPRVLAKAGYRTIHIGKAHFGPFGSAGENPLNLGFDVNVAGCSIGEPGSYRGEDGYGLYGGAASRAVPDLEEFHHTPVFLTEALTVKAKKEIDKALEEGKPFYLNMAHYAVHTPFMSDPEYASRYADSSRSDAAKAYATLIEGMDHSLGEIMDYLETKGIAENTLIIFLGDNGGDAPLGEERGYGPSAPLRGKKGTEFEGGMRVPFIVSWAKPDPASKVQKSLPIQAGTVQTGVGTIMDIYPTVAAIVEADIPQDHPVDGYDLTGMICGRKDPAHPETFLMHFPHNHRGSYFTAYRDGDWKFIYYYSPDNPDRRSAVLYNLAKDPCETTDLLESRPDIAESMFRKMCVQLEKEGALYPVDADGNEVRPVLPESLRHLRKTAVSAE